MSGAEAGWALVVQTRENGYVKTRTLMVLAFITGVAILAAYAVWILRRA
ncbi:MAG TPA: hypothetical protein VIC35_00695 [Acidimicrobiia bacterium]